MAWYEWILSILLFIVSLGALITIHEAGHLSMAKIFKVYCHEFSIGFGPKLLHIRKKGHETYFSIRAVPLGGFVSMYGEGAEELPEFKDIPHERSIEGIRKWKKALILSAGVILNAVLALVLIFISNTCFPLIQQSASTIVKEDSIAYKAGVRTDDRLQFLYPTSMEKDGSIAPFSYEYTTEDKVIHSGNFFIVDNAISMYPDSDPTVLHHYVLTFMFTGDKGNSVLTEGMKLYPALNKEEAKKNEYVNKVFGDWIKEEGSPEYYPNFTIASYSPGEKTQFDSTISFRNNDDAVNTTIIHFATEKDGSKYKWTDVGISFKTKEVWLPFGERVKNTFVEYGNSAVAVFRGIGILFSGGIKNMSGIVGIFETSATLFTNYTFATYLSFWGLISVNLAIFNLLPFPGLDGWQLLVTAIEGATRKKIPNKFKQIMSVIGLGLLFVLMIAIVILDITRIAGV